MHNIPRILSEEKIDREGRLNRTAMVVPTRNQILTTHDSDGILTTTFHPSLHTCVGSVFPK